MRNVTSNIPESFLSYLATGNATFDLDNANTTLDPNVTGSKTLKPYDLLKVPLPMAIVLLVAYTVVFLLAVINNSLVIAVIYRNTQLRTTTNYFIANLAIADLLVSFLVLPLSLLDNLLSEWYYGDFICKAMPYVQGVAVSASVNTLSAVALERYFAIFYPQRNPITPRRALGIVCCIWVGSMSIMIPWPLSYYSMVFRVPGRTPITKCFPFFTVINKKAFIIGVVFLTCYLIPLVFISVCYLLIGIKVWKRNVAGLRGTRAERNIQRSKIKVVRMLVVVFVIFALSWLPLYSINMGFLLGPRLQNKKIELILTGIIHPIAKWMGSSNSCVNPFIYCYFSEPFRKSIISVFKSRSCCGKISV